jgi:tRNA pseudouridine55 synthase
MDGILIVDKPSGVTSHDVVQRARKILKTHKVGHLGTLDPMATGVLPLCIGKATRIGRFFPSSPKEYVGQIRFGFATTTYDREGEADGPERPFEHSRESLEEAMRTFTGKLLQKPPLISAKKIGGEPSYKLARQGKAVESPAVEVEVFSFELTGFAPPLASFRVVCSPGTYVRSLAHDLGQKLGCGAHLESLRRVRSGNFNEREAVPLNDSAKSHVIPIEHLLHEFSSVVVEDEAAEDRVLHGNPIRAGAADGSPSFVRILNKRGEFLAVASRESGWVRPLVVLISPPSDEPRKPR